MPGIVTCRERYVESFVSWCTGASTPPPLTHTYTSLHLSLVQVLAVRSCDLVFLLLLLCGCPCGGSAAGTFGSTPAAVNSTCSGLCLAGTYSLEGVTRCTFCEPGRWVLPGLPCLIFAPSTLQRPCTSQRRGSFFVTMLPVCMCVCPGLGARQVPIPARALASAPGRTVGLGKPTPPVAGVARAPMPMAPRVLPAPEVRGWAFGPQVACGVVRLCRLWCMLRLLFVLLCSFLHGVVGEGGGGGGVHDLV
jgi:hypothetical protein